MGENAGREFIALYLFDKRGKFLEARIDDLGPRAGLDEQRARAVLEQRLAGLGPIEYCRFEGHPFQIEGFYTIFFLIPRTPPTKDGGWGGGVGRRNLRPLHEP